MTNLDERQPRPLAPLLTPKVVGQHFSISPATMYRLIARGVLVEPQVGRQYRVEQDALAAYKAQRGEQATGAAAAREGVDG